MTSVQGYGERLDQARVGGGEAGGQLHQLVAGHAEPLAHAAVDAVAELLGGAGRGAQVVTARPAELALAATEDRLDRHRAAVLGHAGELMAEDRRAAEVDVGEVGRADAGRTDLDELARALGLVDVDDIDAGWVRSDRAHGGLLAREQRGHHARSGREAPVREKIGFLLPTNPTERDRS